MLAVSLGGIMLNSMLGSFGLPEKLFLLGSVLLPSQGQHCLLVLQGGFISEVHVGTLKAWGSWSWCLPEHFGAHSLQQHTTPQNLCLQSIMGS